MDLLEPVWDKARAKAHEEEVELERLITADGGNHKVAPWDWRFYAEKLRAERFAFDEAELKPYLQLEKIIEAAFDVAGRLFGIRFEEKRVSQHGIRTCGCFRCSMPMAANAACSLATILRVPQSVLAHG